MNYKEVVASVLMFFGISAFSKDADGKSQLTDEQKKQLTDKFGAKFVESFTAELAKAEASGETFDEVVTAEMRLKLEAQKAEMDRLKAQAQQLRDEKAALEATIAKLEKEPAADGGKKVPVNTLEAKLKEAGVDLSLKHNRFLCDYLQGKVSGAYSGNSTIDTQELKQEFGKYVDNNRLEILKGLFGQTESTKYMSTYITDKTEVRANQASVINTVLQQFVPKWTPSGAAKFTPLRIKNFKCKLNVPIIPSDIMEDIIGYMYDEQASTLQSMPVVRYILNQLIFPKLDEEREQALATGRFVESTPDGSGNYTASQPGETMDGYLTQLVDYYNADAAAAQGAKLSGIRWLQKGVTINVTGANKNVRTVIDAAVKEVADLYPLYAKKAMKVHIDPVLADAYRREYLEEYKWLKNQDGTHKNDIDFSNFTFAELEGLRGTGCFFITPKENFKHLMSHNPQNVTLRFQEQDYMVKIFGEWWEGTGFWMAEALFAYIAPAAAITYNGKKNLTVSFTNATANATMGSSFNAPTANVSVNGKTVTYESSDTSVATVNSSTGAVTLVAAGKATITAKFAGDTDYNPASGSYELTVAAQGV
ncbi:MAG: Ig-like domain-containing protein [Prevotella sp.]|nr:Ig-like domain-containing protein [Prevotella sp.]